MVLKNLFHALCMEETLPTCCEQKAEAWQCSFSFLCAKSEEVFIVMIYDVGTEPQRTATACQSTWPTKVLMDHPSGTSCLRVADGLVWLPTSVLEERKVLNLLSLKTTSKVSFQDGSFIHVYACLSCL